MVIWMYPDPRDSTKAAFIHILFLCEWKNGLVLKTVMVDIFPTRATEYGCQHRPLAVFKVYEVHSSKTLKAFEWVRGFPSFRFPPELKDPGLPIQLELHEREIGIADSFA